MNLPVWRPRPMAVLKHSMRISGLNRYALAIALAMAFCWSSSFAVSLQVSPVSLRMQGEQTASALWLSNTGKSALHAQVRIFHWTQAGGNDKLTPTTDLVASPPMVSIEPGKRQLVRKNGRAQV